MNCRSSKTWLRRIISLSLFLGSIALIAWTFRSVVYNQNERSGSGPSVFEVVISDLQHMPPPNPKFVGDKVLVINEYNQGDSLYYNLDEDLEIDPRLSEALKIAAKSDAAFPGEDQFGGLASLTPERPLNYLQYFDEKTAPVQGKCFASFWRPGFSSDQKQSIVRVKYGPESHTTIVTYLLERDESSRWKIVIKNIDGYP